MTTRLQKGANSQDIQLMYLSDVNAAPTIGDGDVLVFSETLEQFVPNSGATVSDAQLKEWTESGAYELTAITYDDVNTETVDTATVKWPDGSAGVFTTTEFNTTASPARVNAYTITHVDSGKTVTQASCTVDANGNITVKPALTVA